MPFINNDLLVDIEALVAKGSSRQSFNYKSHMATHIGHVRQVNEDDAYCSDEQSLWLVADGMGGHAFGDKASKTVVDHLRSFVRLGTVTESIHDLETRFSLANKSCRGMLGDKTVGSTIAALFVFESLALFLWAGDSRVYRYRNKRLTLLTEDHNLAQERCRRGELSQDEAQQLPSANVLTRAVGIHQNLRVEIDAESIEADDIYLLCTDGLYRDLSVEQMESVFSTEEFELITSRLLDMSLDAGGKDNITAVTMRASSRET